MVDENNIKDSNESQNDDFLSKLESSDFGSTESESSTAREDKTEKKPDILTPAEQERERLKFEQMDLSDTESEKKKYHTENERKSEEADSMKKLQAIVNPVVTKTPEKPKVDSVNVEPLKKESKVETKIEQNEEKPQVHIMNESEYEKKSDPTKFKTETKSVVDIDDDLEQQMVNSNNQIIYNENNNDIDESNSTESEDSFNSFLGETYTDEDMEDEKVEVVVVNHEEERPEEIIKEKEEVEKSSVTKPSNVYGNGDGNVAFKTRASKVSKMIKQIDLKDTNAVEPIDISKKSITEQQNLYLNTILPTLKPCYSVVPMIISGVVITMTAFGWTDIAEICKIEEKIDEELDPASDDYIYQKNKLFIAKRRKQLDLFYKHIYSVSGFPVKPTQETLFGTIIKEPDFKQLFFAAYAASFQKPYTFTLTCNTCGTTQTRSVASKQLCYLLNKHIDVNRLNYILEKGSTIISDDDSLAVYKEFQKENIVEKSNAIYRSKTPLPSTGLILNLKIPSIMDAIETMEEIVEVFKDKPLELTNDSGDTVAIDSSFGLPKELIILKNYLYINSIIGANPNKSKEDNRIEVAYFEFKDKQTIINTISNLSSSDYKTLVSDPNLHNLIKVRGISYALNGGTCESPSCKVELGLIPIDPETLFFIIGKQDLVD